VHFLFEQQEKRLGGSMAASVISHGVFLVIVLLIMSYKPDYGSNAMLLERAPHEIVWLAQPGAGGGGGGGGNQQKEPIKKRSCRVRKRSPFRSRSRPSRSRCPR